MTIADYRYRFLWIVFLSAQFSGCTHSVKVFVPSGAVIHPRFDRPFTNWAGESVQIELAPSLRGEPLRYLTHYDQVFLANALRESGLRHEYKIAGNGTPLVVYSKNPDITPREKHFPLPGLAFGLTAIREERPGRVPLLKLYDQFDPLVARSGDGLHPIAANYTAILAVLFSRAQKVASSAFRSFLRPDHPGYATGVYLIQPYDPSKIPILFVHGLLSSPLSWENLTNDLCSDPQILAHYQPWFFLYPTGAPVLESAEQLRENLLATQRLFDPKGSSLASRHIVVIAHSMGGLLAHTLVSDSNDELWNAVAKKPCKSLALSADEKKVLSGFFFFRHRSCIDRVIFLAVPHYGSGLAAGIGTIGNLLIRRPKAAAEALKQLAARNPGILQPYFARVNAWGGPTSLFSLAPNPLLERLANLPIQVPFDSIIGDRGLDGGTRSSDGIVPYRSSHLAGAESETVVPASHDALLANPDSVRQIKRILEENLGRSRGYSK